MSGGSRKGGREGLKVFLLDLGNAVVVVVIDQKPFERNLFCYMPSLGMLFQTNVELEVSDMLLGPLIQNQTIDINMNKINNCYTFFSQVSDTF